LKSLIVCIAALSCAGICSADDDYSRGELYTTVFGTSPAFYSTWVGRTSLETYNAIATMGPAISLRAPSAYADAPRLPAAGLTPGRQYGATGNIVPTLPLAADLQMQKIPGPQQVIKPAKLVPAEAGFEEKFPEMKKFNETGGSL
jgi:hypothetical protein